MLTANGDVVVPWTAGYPEHQVRKLGHTGIRAMGVEAIEPPADINDSFGDPLELEAIIATNKTTAETMTRVREVAADKQILVVEDRVKNLKAFSEAISEVKAAIWVQFGAHARGEMAKLATGENPELATAITEGRIIPIASIDQLTDKIAELRAAGVLSDEDAAIFIDYDDTIGNNTQRRDLELAAAVDSIFENGWV